MFIPEVVVFHLFLHQFCPVGGKRRVCVRVYVCVCVLEDPNSFAQVKKTGRNRKGSLFLSMSFFAKVVLPACPCVCHFLLLDNLNWFIVASLLFDRDC